MNVRSEATVNEGGGLAAERAHNYNRAPFRFENSMLISGRRRTATALLLTLCALTSSVDDASAAGSRKRPRTTAPVPAAVAPAAKSIAAPPTVAAPPSPIAATPSPMVPPVDGSPPPGVVEFNRIVDQIVADGRVAGLTTAIVKDGKVVSLHGAGIADADRGTPIGPHTVFRLASASKAFASTLAALLVQDGYLDWGDRVQDRVPAFELSDPHAGPQVTLVDLLSHRVGLPHNSLDYLLERGDPYPLLVYKLREVEMSCPVGDCYGYQNISYALFGDITYAATGDFYEHEVARRIFGPLGMADASIGRESLESTPERALPHDRTGRGWKPFHPNDNYYRVPAAAGVNASAADMAEWLLAHLGHHPEVLRPELLATVHSPLVNTPQETTSAPWRRERVRSASYALGWRVFDYEGHTLIFHGGAVRGYRSIVAMLPDRDLGVAMMWNCETATPSGLLPTLLDSELGLAATDWVGVSPYRPIPAKTASSGRKKKP